MNNIQYLARLSLCFLWIFTGLTSWFIDRNLEQVGEQVLLNVGVNHAWTTALIALGSAVDIIVGVWVLFCSPQSKLFKLCGFVQMVLIIGYSFMLTVMALEFWFHPFGPLVKNVPILVLIAWVYFQSPPLDKMLINSTNEQR